MNIFLIAWNLDVNEEPLVKSCLSSLKESYPLLDPSTLWSFGQGGEVFAACIHYPVSAVSPRVYASHNHAQATLYDGCLVDSNAAFEAHDAGQLGTHWDDLPELAEGQYVAARLCTDPHSMEVITDPLGLYQVYYLQQGNTWLVSNSVQVLTRLCKRREFDPLGVSLFLCLGWAGSDRTLTEGIRVIPGGQRWIWTKGDTEPVREVYFDSLKPFSKPHSRLKRGSIQQLSSSLIQNFRTLASNFGPLKCPITAGHDTRVMLALLTKGKVETNYFCSGPPDSVDMTLARDIARHFDLPYEDDLLADETVTDSWQDASCRLIRQTDGLVHLARIGTVFAEPTSIDRLMTQLHGIGGELGRGKYYGPRMLVRSNDIEFVRRYFVSRLIKNSCGLANQKAVSLTRNYLDHCIDQLLEQGVSVPDIPDAFHVRDRIPRWAGVGYRPYFPTTAVFSPFCTRPFINTVFSLPPLIRYSERVHYRLISSLMPELHNFPSDKQWPPQNQALFLADLGYKVIARRLQGLAKSLSGRKPDYVSPHLWPSYDKTNWIEGKNGYFRSICLDQPNSSLWELVDRSVLEDMTTRPMPKEEKRRSDQFWQLLGVVGLFQYAQVSSRLSRFA